MIKFSQYAVLTWREFVGINMGLGEKQIYYILFILYNYGKKNEIQIFRKRQIVKFG